MRPQALLDLFPELSREQWRAEGFAFGEVTKEAVYLLPSARHEAAHPDAAAVSQPRRRGDLGRRAGALPAAAAPRTPAPRADRDRGDQLIVDRRTRATACAPATRVADAMVQPLPPSSPAATCGAGDGARRGQLGAPDRRRDPRVRPRRGPRAAGLGARRQGGLEGARAARPRDPHDRTVAAEPARAATGRSAAAGSTRCATSAPARTSSASASSSTSTTPTRRPRPTTCCSCSSSTRWSGRSSTAASASSWGAKALPGGGWWSMPRLSMPGAVIVGDAGGMVDTVALKGVHHAITSGRLAAEAIHAALARGERRFDAYEAGARATLRPRRELYRVRNAPPAVPARLRRAARRSSTSRSRPRAACRPAGCAWHRNDEQRDVHRLRPHAATPSPTAATPSTSSPRVYISGNATRDDAPNHIRVRQQRAARARRDMALDVPGRRLRDPPTTRPSTGDVDVIVNYTNCVQCGAITAKGGRLTPPEGGDGPLYQP